MRMKWSCMPKVLRKSSQAEPPSRVKMGKIGMKMISKQCGELDYCKKTYKVTLPGEVSSLPDKQLNTLTYTSKDKRNASSSTDKQSQKKKSKEKRAKS